MKIIRLAFTETCPHCKHQNEISAKETWLICENCGGKWASSIYSKINEEPRAFRNSPIPEGYDRRIRQ